MTSHVGPGVYVLDFHTAINDKLILASASFASPGYRHVVAGPCGGPPDGAAACSVGGDNNHVAVFTATAAAPPVNTDFAFYVAVIG